jgi:translation initiation factor 1 (eIF-1/SUI1)
MNNKKRQLKEVLIKNGFEKSYFKYRRIINKAFFSVNIITEKKKVLIKVNVTKNGKQVYATKVLDLNPNNLQQLLNTFNAFSQQL